jgi:hypothetical protein
MANELIWMLKTADARCRSMLFSAMIGGAVFGFLAAGVVGWMIWGPGLRFASWGAFFGLLLVATGKWPEFLKSHLTVNHRRSFWAGYLLALGTLGIGVIPMLLALGLFFVVVVPVTVTISGSTTDLGITIGDMLVFWGDLSMRVLAGVLLTCAVSILLLAGYAALKRRRSHTDARA